MKRITSALVLSIFVLAPVIARADDDDDRWERRRDRDRYYRDGRYRNDTYRNGPYYGNGGYGNGPYYGNGGYGNGGYRNGGYGRGYSPVDRAIQNLQSMSYNRVDGHDRDHFNDGLNDLFRFQQKWQNGQWDRGRLDKAIEHIQHLANSDRMNPRDRQILQNDANALRSFRSSGGSGGYYGNNGGYRNNGRWPF